MVLPQPPTAELIALCQYLAVMNFLIVYFGEEEHFPVVGIEVRHSFQ